MELIASGVFPGWEGVKYEIGPLARDDLKRRQPGTYYFEVQIYYRNPPPQIAVEDFYRAFFDAEKECTRWGFQVQYREFEFYYVRDINATLPYKEGRLKLIATIHRFSEIYYYTSVASGVAHRLPLGEILRTEVSVAHKVSIQTSEGAPQTTTPVTTPTVTTPPPQTTTPVTTPTGTTTTGTTPPPQTTTPVASPTPQTTPTVTTPKTPSPVAAAGQETLITKVTATDWTGVRYSIGKTIQETEQLREGTFLTTIDFTTDPSILANPRPRLEKLINETLFSLQENRPDIGASWRFREAQLYKVADLPNGQIQARVKIIYTLERVVWGRGGTPAVSPMLWVQLAKLILAALAVAFIVYNIIRVTHQEVLVTIPTESGKSPIQMAIPSWLILALVVLVLLLILRR